MKKIGLMLALAVGLVACSEEPTAPRSDLAEFGELAELSLSSSFVSDPGHGLIPLLRFPEALKLSTAQEAQIRALVEQFRAAARSDHEALAAIMRQAREGVRAGKSRDEVGAILAQGDAIRLRLEAAERKLREDILAVLTPEQKAWLESQQPRRCNAEPLSEAQRTEIAALIAAFDQANKTDLDAIKAALEQARALHRSGASREEVQAILTSVAPAMARIAAAHIELRAAINAVLTPEQRACAPGASRLPGMHRSSR